MQIKGLFLLQEICTQDRIKLIPRQIERCRVEAFQTKSSGQLAMPLLHSRDSHLTQRHLGTFPLRPLYHLETVCLGWTSGALQTGGSAAVYQWEIVS